jgi:hypothetical protein
MPASRAAAIQIPCAQPNLFLPLPSALLFPAFAVAGIKAANNMGKEVKEGYGADRKAQFCG